MAGHSKWAKIKRSKGAADSKRAAQFGKLSSKISIAVKTGGGANPDFNFQLKSAIDKAKESGMPADTIKRAIAKGSGEGGEAELKEIIYEGYLPGGVAVMVVTATDNTNRTYSDVRNAFTKSDGSLGTNGCVAYMFEKRGEIHLEKSKWSDKKEEKLLSLAMEAGADDLDTSDEDEVLVLCKPENLEEVSKAFEKLIDLTDFKVLEVLDKLVPNNNVAVTNKEDANNILKAMSILEENDDVMDVIANFDIEEELIEV